MRNTAIVGVAFLATALSCNRVIEPETEVDGRALCNKNCDLLMACGPDDHPYATEEECFDDCVEAEDWVGECGPVREVYMECLVDLTCEEFQATFDDLEESPCYDLSFNYATCHRDN